MESKIEMFLVWGFSFLTIFTQSNIMFILACLASVTTIMRNWPAVKDWWAKTITKLKK